jgi:hypothetical protein
VREVIAQGVDQHPVLLGSRHDHQQPRDVAVERRTRQW